MAISLNIILPDDALAAIDARAEWVGQVKATIGPGSTVFSPDSLRITFPAVRRNVAAAKVIKATRAKEVHVLSKLERLIIDAWNDSEFIREHAAQETRNNPIKSREVQAILLLLRRLLKETGAARILEWMGQYFDSCLKQKHIWQDHNHGYNHLGGFLRAILRFSKDGKPLNWMKEQAGPIHDPQADLTMKLANAYAVKWLGRQAFGLVNPSVEYSRFLAASGRLAEFIRANQWPEDRAVGCLLEAVGANWGLGGSPPVGALSSENTWKIVFPAYLKALYG